MAVGFVVDCSFFKVGMGDFLHSFFSTICGRLESGKWGSKYPYLMNNLYQGELEVKDVPKARAELAEIQEKLKAYPPSDVIWDIDDLSQRPPWGDDISDDITDLSNYYVTSDGQDLISVIFGVFKEAEKIDSNITILNL